MWLGWEISAIHYDHTFFIAQDINPTVLNIHLFMYKEVRPFACGHNAIQMAGQESFKW